MLNNIYIIVVCVLTFSQAVSAQKMMVKWEKEYVEKDNYFYIPRSMTFDNGLLNISGMSYENETYNDGKIWYWKVDVDGEKKAVVDMAGSSSDKILAFHRSPRGLAISKDKATIPVNSSSGAALIAISGGVTGQNTSINKLSHDTKLGRWNVIAKMIQTPSGDIVLAGNSLKTDAIAALYDGKGNSCRWVKIYTEGTGSFFSDIVELDGYLYFAGISSNGKQMYSNFSTILYKCDMSGNVIAKQILDGGGLFENKHPKLAIGDGEILMSYDMDPAVTGSKIMVVRFNQDMEKLHEFCAYSADKQGLVNNDIIVLPNKFFVVAYNIGNSIEVKLYNKSGEALDTVELSDYAVHGGIQLACSDNMIFLVASTIHKDAANKNQKRIVRSGDSFCINAKICALEITE